MEIRAKYIPKQNTFYITIKAGKTLMVSGVETCVEADTAGYAYNPGDLISLLNRVEGKIEDKIRNLQELLGLLTEHGAEIAVD